MKLNQRKIRIALTIITIAIFTYVGQNYFSELGRIRDAHWLGIAAIALIHLVTLLVQGFTLQIALAALRQSIRTREGFSLTILSSYSNLLLPKSGIGIIALYLNRVRKINLSRYSTVVLFNASMFVLVCGISAIVVYFAHTIFSGETFSAGLASVVLAILVGLISVAFVSFQLPRWYRGPGWRFLFRMNRAWRQLRSPRIVLQIATLHVVLLFLRASRFYIAFLAMGIQVSFLSVLLASVFGDLAFIISVTPSALGFREAAVMFSAGALGITPSIALSVTLLDRLVFSMTVVIVAQVVMGVFIRGKSEPSENATRSGTLFRIFGNRVAGKSLEQ